MKRMRALFFCVLMLVACSGVPPAPPWLSNAVSRLEQFKSEYLGGRMDVAQMNFDLALAEVKKSGDMELLGRVYLTRVALSVAILKPAAAEDFLALQNLFPSPKNGAYYAMLEGRFDEVDIRLLPEAYVKFVRDSLKKETKMASVIQEIKDPVSRLIACGVYTTRKGDDEGVLLMAIDTCSAQGWKRALRAYLERLAAYYERAGQVEQAGKVKARLSLMGP